VILFVWGRKKVLPVDIVEMTTKEEEFSSDLYPTRCTVSVKLQVIEGANVPFLVTQAANEVMASINARNYAEFSNTVVPA
jgi:hypothetical protein